MCRLDLIQLAFPISKLIQLAAVGCSIHKVTEINQKYLWVSPENDNTLVSDGS